MGFNLGQVVIRRLFAFRLIFGARCHLSGRPVQFATSHIIGREGKSTNNKTMRPDTKTNGDAHY